VVKPSGLLLDLFDGLLANEFEAAELPAADASPQRKFCGRERPPQRSRPLSALLILTPQRLESLP
jgi:hypothetical protein